MAKKRLRLKLVQGFTCPDCKGRMRYTTASIGQEPIFQCFGCSRLYTLEQAVFKQLVIHAHSSSPGVIPEAP